MASLSTGPTKKPFARKITFSTEKELAEIEAYSKKTICEFLETLIQKNIVTQRGHRPDLLSQNIPAFLRQFIQTDHSAGSF